ncbi:MAG: hypothetical protein MUE94_12950 [Verrucomicrobia bacterium]|jgi:hypothetical protein|nr:hypothetical protein [Verrucomicrobiota bacterium]
MKWSVPCLLALTCACVLPARGQTVNPSLWKAFTNPANGFGTWIQTGPDETNHTFIDDFTSLTSGQVADGVRSYRVSSQKP